MSVRFGLSSSFIIPGRGRHFIARAVSLGKFSCILTGRRFYYLASEIQAAVLAHEEGHIELKHTEARLLFALFPPFWFLFPALCRQQEFSADRYAAERGHAKALCQLLANEYDGGWLQPSHAERREALKRHDQLRLVLVTNEPRLAGVTEP